MKDHDPVVAFFKRVNDRAEADILKGNPVEGAHHRALQYEIERYLTIGDGTTHYDQCWRVHIGCAVGRIEELEQRLEVAEKDAAVLHLMRRMSGLKD